MQGHVNSGVPLLHEFRSLSMLLTAATTINRGQPSEPPQPASEKYHGSLERLSKTRELALNAIATLLVRADEIIAVVGHDSQQVFAMQNEVPQDHRKGSDSYLQTLMSKAFPSIPDFSALANPNRKKPSRHFPDPKSQCVIAKPGISRYNLISDSSWDCLTIDKNDPLENHIATLVEFIRRYRVAEQTQRHGVLQTFHRYMVAASWEKMHRRVTHVYSRHSLGILNTLTPQNMRNIFKEFSPKMKPSPQKDSSLASMLVSLDEQEALESILEVHLEGYQASMELQRGSLKSLVDAFRTTLSSQHQKGMSAYNAQTCFPFHLLLVATIAGFTASLESLRFASTSDDRQYAHDVGATRAEDRKKYAQHVIQFGRLLRDIAYSDALTLHLELLELGNFLRTPSNTSSGHMDTQAPSDDDNDNEDEDNDVAEELGRLEKDKAVTLRRWIQLLVSYWVALDTIAKFSAYQGTSGANINLIHVRAQLGRKMAPWDATIRRLASLPAAADPNDPFDAEAAIATFIKRIQDPNLVHRSVKAFRKTNIPCVVASPEDVVFIGNIHCEVGMAAFFEYFHHINFNGTREAAQFIQTANRNFIAVSKLCCPACSIFLSHLGNSDSFKVRGRHATMYTVDLPPWVPLDMLEKMVTEFRNRLLDELVLMKDEMAEPGPERRSMESDSCLSTASNDSALNKTDRAEWLPIVPRRRRF